MSELIAQPAIEPRAAAEQPRLADSVATRLALLDLPMVALAVLAGALYLVNLTVSGYANTYYGMAAQAASQSWTAWFFGALDASSFITIDKPPLATMLMGLSVKALGLSSWSILLPQALLGVGSVLVLYLAVRRSFGRTAALIAGAAMAVTPVAVLIFRYDNPDALLTFLMVTAAWALGRGLEHGRLRWPILAATLVGAAFLTKYLQAYLVLPAFALVWLVSAPVSLRRRLGGLLAAGVTFAISSGWWVAVVELLPASARPYIGGSTTNSALELLLGYDGLGRIFGGGRGPAGGTGLGSANDGLAFNNPVGRGGPSFGGDPGPLRLFNDQFGGQVAWLLPAALLALAVGLIAYRRAARTDRRVAGYLLWGGWLTVHVGVFSFMSGIIHPYSTVALAPAVGALVGGGASELWSRRRLASRAAGPTLGLGVLATGVTAWLLLERTPDFAPGLGIGVLALSVAAAIVLAIPAALTTPPVTRVALGAALVAALAGPMAYSLDTMSMSLAGGDPSAGPAVAGAFGGAGGVVGDTGGADPALVEYLVANQGSARWIVAANGSHGAAGIQLAAGQPVMAMGGFSGGDPAPTLDQLKAYIASGELRFVFLGGGAPGGGFAGGRGGGPGGGDSNARTAWITASCTPVVIAGATTDLYDCAPAA